METSVSLGTAILSGPGTNPSAIYETLRANDRPYVDIEAALAPPPADHACAQPAGAAFVASVGSGNYGHWLVDDLPRIPLLSSDTIVLPDFGPVMNSVRRESVAMLAPGRTCVFAPHDRFISFGDMEYVTPTSFHPHLKCPSLLRQLRTAMAPGAARRDAGRKIFVPRLSGTRQIENHGEVAAFLEAQGFEVVDVRAMSVAEQIRRFAAADIVIGTMGAAMTTSMFCPQAARIGYLAPTGWKEPFFWDLAAAMDQRYAAVFGGSADEGPSPHLRNFRVELADLEALTDWCLS